MTHYDQKQSVMALKIDRDAFKSLARNDILSPHLDAVIDQGDFPWTFTYEPKVEDDAWHPSGDCTPSVHELWLKATGKGKERPVSPSLRKTFIVGHFWHAYIQWLLVNRLEFADASAIERKGCKVWCDNNSGSPSPYWWATGSGDIAPCTIPQHGEYLVDIKTMTGNAFNGNRLPAWAADKYECQINIYMDFFDLERALILCVQKDSPHEFKEFKYERNDALIDAIYKKWKLVGRCLVDGVEPDPDYECDLPLAGPLNE
jgi:hypothetical protein